MKYLSTGEFAEICKVNKQTLIYYDQIGLFKPTYKDDKGFRYYKIGQFDLFIVIQLLKELGMPLKEIQAYTANKSPDTFIQLMQQQKQKVKEKIQSLEKLE